MTKRAKVTGFIFWTMVIAAVFFFIFALITPSTDQDPAGIAGLCAPIVALCTALMALAQASNSGEVPIRPKPGIYIGFGMVISAYLWIADAGDNHPLDPELAIVILVFFALAAVGALVIPLPGKQDNTQPVDQPSKEEHGDQ